MPYQPSRNILKKYADVLVNFALGKGKGVKKGDVVYVEAYEYSKPLYAEILRAITKAGGNVIAHYMPDTDRTFNTTRDFFVNAKEHQIQFFPSKYFRGLVDEVDHFLLILSDTDMEALKDIPPHKLMARAEAIKPYRAWRDEKENLGKLSWTIALYGTPAMAKEAGLSERAYWGEITKACFLNTRDPVAVWRRVERDIASLKNRLNRLPIERLHIKGPDTNLWITLGKRRLWDGGGGANIPSFEIFTSPDWRGTEGWIRFNNPVYSNGNLITGIELTFKGGKVVRAKAKKNEQFLKTMLRVPGGNRVGEFSLTDRRFSKITKFMAETLYDENVGGPHGNMHIALGRSFHFCYGGKMKGLTERDWAKLGFNSSAIHQDIISTAPRTVTAYLKSGKTKVIYRNGRFTI